MFWKKTPPSTLEDKLLGIVYGRTQFMRRAQMTDVSLEGQFMDAQVKGAIKEITMGTPVRDALIANLSEGILEDGLRVAGEKKLTRYERKNLFEIKRTFWQKKLSP